MKTEHPCSGEEFNKVIADYQNADRTGKEFNINGLVSIINRYNAPWELAGKSDHGEVGNKTNGPHAYLPSIVTSMAGAQGVTPIASFCSQSYFFRLNFIKQLGLTFLSVNLDGAHNRLAHCVGTVQCAERFIRSLHFQDEVTITPTEELAIRIGAFIHDNFHGPFGHSLDMLHDVFLGDTSYRRLDKCLLLNSLKDKDSELRKILDRCLPSEMRSDVCQYLEFFFDKNTALEIDPSWHERYFLSQIIDSDFDADRIDFVLRDSMHLGLPPMNEDALYEVIESIKVLPVEIDSNEGNGKITPNLICFSKKYQKTIDEFLARRRDLYLDYYENPIKLIVDDMLAHVVYHVLDSVKITPNWWSPQERTVQIGFLSKLHTLTDDGLIHFLYEVGGYNPISTLATHMLNDILGNRPFCEILREDIEVRKAKEIETNWKKVNDEFRLQQEAKLKKIPRNNPSSKLSISSEEQYNMLSNILDNKEKESSLLYFAWFFSGGFVNKYIAETLLWALLLEDPQFKEIYRNYLQERFGKSEKLFIDIEKIPMVHITLPTYAAVSEREIHEYATEPVTPEKIAYYTDTSVTILTPDLPKREDLKKTMVIVSADRQLSEESAVRAIINNKFTQFLYKDRFWLDARRLEF